METVADLLGRAEELLDRGNYRGVEELLEPEKNSGNPGVLCLLGFVYLKLGKHQEAINHLNHSLSLKPDYILALARRGLAYQCVWQVEKATTDFEQAITFEAQDYQDWCG